MFPETKKNWMVQRKICTCLFLAWWRYFGDGFIQTTVAKIFQVAQQFLRKGRKVLELMAH